ncbi:transketolase subunit A [Anaerobacterium chartisolvens]|uniref:Transketolase subunit A n=1 Tax=Anaerobacterium chartisolvens TaxID=1297424 RepID=A0A369ATH7_9FIRM|nr:transketolase [Anaerobacterium chartisolvens]RCX12385.1 transketolase subunit A [Anaerobacterium chartisolvens]
MEIHKLKELKKQAVLIRKHIIDEVYSAASGHPGGSLSCTDILTALYFNEMRVDVKNPQWEDRDRFVLSKGHCAPALYAALAEKGFFPKEDLVKFRSADSYLEGHPSMRYVTGVDMSTGSLGQGISAAVGMGIAGKLDNKDYRVYAILGDGELQEGQVWEASMAAAHYKLDNLTAFLDHNGLQIDGNITDVMSPEPVANKFEAFGWNVINIDGHDLTQITEAIDKAKNTKGKPTMIVCATVKGKGVSFMENNAGWHGTAPNKEQRDQAIAELNDILSALEVE